MPLTLKMILNELHPFLKIKPFIFLFLFVGFSCSAFAQKKVIEADTLPLDTTVKHSPKKAALFSAVLPGLGQAYNKKYWKIPIIYAGVATTLYFANKNHQEFKTFKSAYLSRVDDDPSTIDDLPLYSDANLLTLTEYYRRNRDLFVIGTVVVYALNVIDAAVDAHLFYFDVSDDLSLNVLPNFNVNATGAYTGFYLTLNF